MLRKASRKEIGDRELGGPVDHLRRIAHENPRVVDLVIAGTGPHYGYATPADRDLFWQVFQAPVIEEFHDFAGGVVARECAAHEGLHIVEGAEIEIRDGGLWLNGRPAGAMARVDASPCGCGLRSPRLVDIRETRAATPREEITARS